NQNRENKRRLCWPSLQFPEEDSTRDHHVSVTLLDQDVLECPICCEPLKIPIFQCDNGHLACSLCCNKVKNICPSCTLPIGYSRCRAMEKVIEATRVSCPHAKYGCKENISYGNQSSHEKLCVFTPCSCPMSDCNYTGSYNDLMNHVDVEHKEDLLLFSWDTPLKIKFNLGEKLTILKEKNHGKLIVVQGSNGSQGMIVRVSCFAPSVPESERLSLFCSLKLKSLNYRLKHGLKVTNIQKMSDEQPEYGFMLVPSYMLGRTYMDICISHRRAEAFY
ncbi:hypothetical protein EUTSA_v10028143mg, partial [Eutrema salsugineum]